MTQGYITKPDKSGNSIQTKQPAKRHLPGLRENGEKMMSLDPNQHIQALQTQAHPC